MKSIHSAVQPGTLLHVVSKMSALAGARQNLSPDGEFLQACLVRLPLGKQLRPHRHRPLARTSEITQEAWLIIAGKIESSYYDLDGQLLCRHLLGPGDCSVTFRGGHAFEVLEADTVIFECKLGPYYGPERDLEYFEPAGPAAS
jgi:hypothetical protein